MLRAALKYYFKTAFMFVSEWLWRCRVRGFLLRGLAICFALVSVVVVWSELTFFSTSPTISLFAVFVDLAKANYDYFTIEVINP